MFLAPSTHRDVTLEVVLRALRIDKATHQFLLSSQYYLKTPIVPWEMLLENGEFCLEDLVGHRPPLHSELPLSKKPWVARLNHANTLSSFSFPRRFRSKITFISNSKC